MNQYETLRALGQQARDIFDAAVAADEDMTEFPDFSVVDIGAGDGAPEYSPFFAEIATRYTGVDLDEHVLDNSWVDEPVRLSAEDFAEQHKVAMAAGTAKPFDIATAIYVWEHHPKPAELLRAIHDVLAPGGKAFLITPNGIHPFGLASKVLAKTGLTDTVLRRLRPDEIDHYHFHVEATRNTPRQVRKCAEEAGFADVEVSMHDDPGVFTPYLPEKLHALPQLYSKAIAAAKLDVLSGTLIITLTKDS